MQKENKNVYTTRLLCMAICILLLISNTVSAFADTSVTYIELIQAINNYLTFGTFYTLSDFVSECSSMPGFSYMYDNLDVLTSQISYDTPIILRYAKNSTYSSVSGTYTISTLDVYYPNVNNPYIKLNGSNYSYYCSDYMYSISLEYDSYNDSYDLDNTPLYNSNGILMLFQSYDGEQYGGTGYNNTYLTVLNFEGNPFGIGSDSNLYTVPNVQYINYYDVTTVASASTSSGYLIKNPLYTSPFTENDNVISEGDDQGKTIGQVAYEWICNLGFFKSLADMTGMLIYDNDNEVMYYDPTPKNYTIFEDSNVTNFYDGYINEDNVFIRTPSSSTWSEIGSNFGGSREYNYGSNNLSYKYDFKTGRTSYKNHNLDGIIVHTDTSDIYLANGSSALETYEAIQNSAHKTINTGHYIVNNPAYTSNLQSTVNSYVNNNRLNDIYGLLNAIKNYEYVDILSTKYTNNSLNDMIGQVETVIDTLNVIKDYLGFDYVNSAYPDLMFIKEGLGVPYLDHNDGHYFITNSENLPIAEVLTRNYLALTSRQDNGLIANTYEYNGETISNPYYFLSQYMNDNHINIGYIEQSVESLADDIVSGIEDILEDVFPQSQPDTNTTIINNITNVDNDINISGENITSGYSLLNRIVGFFKYTVSDSVDFVSLVTDNDNWQLWSEEAYSNFGY